MAQIKKYSSSTFSSQFQNIDNCIRPANFTKQKKITRQKHGMLGKNILLNLFGGFLILYVLVIPFLGVSFVYSLAPIILLSFSCANSFSWKIHDWTWNERYGDLISICAVSFLGYLRAYLHDDVSCSLPKYLQYIIGIAIIDTLGYWIHYTSHYSKLLWKLHIVHHSRPVPTIYNSSYEHLGDAILRLIAPGLILVFLGFDKEVIATISCLTGLIGAVSHLNLDIPIPKPFIWLIVNPITHRIHHNKNEIATNNGNITHIWDHIMGTYAFYEMPPEEYGLTEDQQISDAPSNILFTTLKQKP